MEKNLKCCLGAGSYNYKKSLNGFLETMYSTQNIITQWRSSILIHYCMFFFLSNCMLAVDFLSTGKSQNSQNLAKSQPEFILAIYIYILTIVVAYWPSQGLFEIGALLSLISQPAMVTTDGLWLGSPTTFCAFFALSTGVTIHKSWLITNISSKL